MSDTKKKAYGSHEIAKLCQVTPGTVNTWFKQKKFPTFRTAGGHFRVWESDVIILLKSLGIPVPSEMAQRSKNRYLIVDDDAIIRRFIRRLLEKADPKCEIFEAVDGFEAGFKTAQLKPALVTLDLNLPGVNGIRVCRMIRREKETGTIKILAVTGHRPDKTKRVMLKAGADAFLAKPFEGEEFIRIVKDLLKI